MDVCKQAWLLISAGLQAGKASGRTGLTWPAVIGQIAKHPSKTLTCGSWIISDVTTAASDIDLVQTSPRLEGNHRVKVCSNSIMAPANYLNYNKGPTDSTWDIMGGQAPSVTLPGGSGWGPLLRIGTSWAQTDHVVCADYFG